MSLNVEFQKLSIIFSFNGWYSFVMAVSRNFGRLVDDGVILLSSTLLSLR